MTKCPRCFVTLPQDVYTWMSLATDKTEVDPVATLYHGSPVSSGPFQDFRSPPNSPPGVPPPPEFVAERMGGPAVEVCPTCHYQLPNEWRRGQATCVAMAGARATGKTVYIAVLIKQLQQLGEQIGQIVDPATHTTEVNYRDYYETPLYTERGILESTPAAETGNPYQRHPLVFNLGMWAGLPRYLVIRDVAGEDLENPANADAQWLNFFSHADGVIFMFDPLKVDVIRDQLFDLVPAQERVGGDPTAVLRTVRNIVGSGNPKLAVVLSKFDALQALASVEGSTWAPVMANPGAAFSRDQSLLNAPYHDQDGRLLHEEVRSLLQRLDASTLVMAAERRSALAAQDSRFFAVSALGESPVGDKLHSSGISPFRCLDPVRWILARQGVW